MVALTASHGGQALGLSGLTAPENRLNTLLPLATVTVTGLVNMFVLRPITTNVMRERKHQGTLAAGTMFRVKKSIEYSNLRRNP